MAYAGAGAALTRREPQAGDPLALGFAGSLTINPIAGAEYVLVHVYARTKASSLSTPLRFYLPGMSGSSYIATVSGSAGTGSWGWQAHTTSSGTPIAGHPFENVWEMEFLARGPASEMPVTINYTVINNGIAGQPAGPVDAIITARSWGFFEPGAPIISVTQTSFLDNNTGKYVASLPSNEAWVMHRHRLNGIGAEPLYAAPYLGEPVPYNDATNTGIAPTSITPNGFTLRTTSPIYPPLAFWSRSNIPQPGTTRVPWPVSNTPQRGNIGRPNDNSFVGITNGSFYEDLPPLLPTSGGVFLGLGV